MRNRNDLKYKPNRIQTLVTQIKATLNAGKAVRLAVIDNPIGMSPLPNGSLVAYLAGGHTVLVVGYREAPTQFMYIDPWIAGSKMKYTGGIKGNKFDDEACPLLGLMTVTHDPARKANSSDMGDNIIRQDVSTQGSFNDANGRFLEVVSAPFALLGN